MRRRTAVVLIVVGVVSAAVVACAVLAVGGRGPLGALVCPVTVTRYDEAPYPAQRWQGTITLRAGDQASVGGHGDPLPADTPPELIGAADAVQVTSVVRPTEQRCDRVVSGYRFYLLTANRDVVLERMSENPVRIRVTQV
jgi:hypothetical protein